MRIERLWVDLTSFLGAKWSDFFYVLELRHGLDHGNPSHIWLLHYLFLVDINEETAFFVRTWNEHRLRIRNGPNRSPLDMWGFDMLTQGFRGEELSPEDLEVYGVDWEAFCDWEINNSQLANNPVTEPVASWVGQVGPPDHLSHVEVDDVNSPFSADEQPRVVWKMNGCGSMASRV